MFRKFLVALVGLVYLEDVIGGPWTYEKGNSNCDATSANPCGPAYWGRVSGASGCLSSQSQTPIDFNGVNSIANLTIAPPVFTINQGGCNQWVAFTNQYVLEVDFNVAAKNVACQNMYVTFEGVDYTLLQMHFHSPSEHTVGNGRYAAEAHMVHQSLTTGGYLVIGVFLQVDSTDTPANTNTDDKNEYDDGVNRNNKFLNSIWNSNKPFIKNFATGGTNLYASGSGLMNPYRDLTPGKKSMYHYYGGLTTPPCVVPGGVNWWVYDNPVIISANDLYYLRKIVQVNGNYLSNRGDNARPVQPLNGRLVSYIPSVPAAKTNYPTAAPITQPGTTASPTVSKANRDALILGAIAITFVIICMFVVIFILYVLLVQRAAQPETKSVEFSRLPTGDDAMPAPAQKIVGVTSQELVPVDNEA